MTLSKLQPTEIWKYFEEILTIPRPSKKEEKIIAYLLDFGKKHNLDTRRDEAGNVIITKPATKGYEKVQPVVLQSHIDMVCEKNSDVKHDFNNDPIQAYVEGNWVKAKGTTLGADDGIGIAAQLAVLASKTIEHGPIECLFTTDEETGLTGAFEMKSGFFKSKILLNLDSEDEGELFIGCAGGVDTVVTFAYHNDRVPSNSKAFKISVTGLKLSWTPGEFANQHRIQLSADAEAVNAGTAIAATQDANSFDATGLLDFGTTYYWRIDESNSVTGWDNGSVWSFTTESFSYPLTGVTATASTAQPNMGPENTINGSGLDDADGHSADGTDMWMTTGVKPDWIQYEFDSVRKLDKMLVWNSNQLVESFLGFGAKSVTVEYSVDGQSWTTLEGAPEFSKATGAAGYQANTTVNFNGAVAKFVKLTINSNWGGVTPQTGLSEVRFFYIPVQASEPDPADGATGVAVGTALTWRSGREAASHKVFFGSDKQAVADGTATAATVSENSYTPAGLTFGGTYYWKVTEVNQAAATAEWASGVWAFTVEQFGAIDDFEGYNDEDYRIYQAWEDGLTNGASNSQVGYNESPFAEKAVVHGGRQAMPLIYDNSKSPYYSEATRTFDTPQDLTAHGADSLCVWFQGIGGDTGNSSEALYITVKDNAGKSKTIASVAAATVATSWQQWTIPLSEFTSAGVKMTAVKSIVIGVGNQASPTAGGSGKVYIDDLGYGRSAQ
ncbi:MAG: M20/M25/M40 family metallo-hydrolase [Solirubrobacterales bacterium]